MNKQIPTLFLSLITLFFSCHEHQRSLSNDRVDPILKEIPSSWTMLTEYNGQLVIFYPCDANNPVVDFRHDTLHINWGLEEGFYHITSVAKPSPGQLTLTGETDLGETKENFYATFLDNEKKLSRWYVWLDDTTSAVFTDSRFDNQYKIVKQPCTECWGYDVCNEVEEQDSVHTQGSPELIAGSDF
jgi:hypothetical protein